MNLDVFRRNIPKVYWLNFLWGFLLIQPVIVPFFQSRGLAMTEVFAVQTAFSVTLCLLDVPTGYLSDLFGRKITLLLASALKGTGGVMLCIANGWLELAAAYVVIGVANSLFSGSDVALLYESVETLPEGDRPPSTALFGRRVSFSLAGATVSALVGGATAAWFSLDVAIVANAVLAWAPLLICLTLKDAPRTQVVRKTHLQNFGRLGRELFAESRFVRAVVFATVLYTAAPVLSVYVFQAFWKSEGLSMALFGPLTAAFSLVGAFSGWFAHRFEKRRARRGRWRWSACCRSSGFWAAPGCRSPWPPPSASFSKWSGGWGRPS